MALRARAVCFDACCFGGAPSGDCSPKSGKSVTSGRSLSRTRQCGDSGNESGGPPSTIVVTGTPHGPTYDDASDLLEADLGAFFGTLKTGDFELLGLSRSLAHRDSKRRKPTCRAKVGPVEGSALGLAQKGHRSIVPPPGDPPEEPPPEEPEEEEEEKPDVKIYGTGTGKGDDYFEITVEGTDDTDSWLGWYFGDDWLLPGYDPFPGGDYDPRDPCDCMPDGPDECQALCDRTLSQYAAQHGLPADFADGSGLCMSAQGERPDCKYTCACVWSNFSEEFANGYTNGTYPPLPGQTPLTHYHFK